MLIRGQQARGAQDSGGTGPAVPARQSVASVSKQVTIMQAEARSGVSRSNAAMQLVLFVSERSINWPGEVSCLL